MTALFSIRQNACDDFVHTCLCADGTRGALIVSGQHHDTDSHILQFFHRTAGCPL